MSESQEDVQCPEESAYTAMITKAQQGNFMNEIGNHCGKLEQKENRDNFIEKCFKDVHANYVAINEKVDVKKQSTIIVENVVQTLNDMRGELYESSTSEKDIQNLFVTLFKKKKISQTTVTSEFSIPNLGDSKRRKRTDVLIEFQQSGKKYAFLLEFKKGMTQGQANTALPQLFNYSRSLMRKNIIVLGLLLLFNGCGQNNYQRMYCYAWPYAKQLRTPRESAQGSASNGGGAPSGAGKRKRQGQGGSAQGGDADGSGKKGDAEGHVAASNKRGQHEVNSNNVPKIVNKEQYAPLKTLQEFLLLNDSGDFGEPTITYITDKLEKNQITLRNTPEFRKSNEFITFWKDWYNLFCKEANISQKVYLNFSEAIKNKNQHNLTFVLYQHEERWFLLCCVEKTEANFQWYLIREKGDNEKQPISADELQLYNKIESDLKLHLNIKLFNYKFSHPPNDVSYSAVHAIYNLLLASLLKRRDESFSIGFFNENPSEIIPTFDSEIILQKMLFFINSQDIIEINMASVKGNVEKNMITKKYWYLPSSILTEDIISSNFEEIQKGSVLLEPQQKDNGVQYAVGIVIQKDGISFTIEFPGFPREKGLYKIFTGYYEEASDDSEFSYYAKKNISEIPPQPRIPLYLCKSESLFLNGITLGRRNNQTVHDTLVDHLVRKIELLLHAQ